MSDETLIVDVAPGRGDLLELVRELFAEYQSWLGDAVCSARLAEEIAGLPGPYAAPQGRLLLAMDDGVAIGCVGIRPHHGTACEMKRLYVRPWARGQGVAGMLAEAAAVAARAMGYESVLLSTVSGMMDAAQGLYERMGFVKTEPFDDLSGVAEGEGIVHMRLDLRGRGGQ